jgi:DNA-binding HxlR family transcriptional regulator
MHKANLATLPCSLARSLQIVGEWWTLLVLRDVCFGWNRFEAIHEHLGIARNILKARLDTLADHGMLDRRRYQRHPDRYEYLPTQKTLDLVPAILAIVAWGDRWTAPDGPPAMTRDGARTQTNAGNTPLIVGADTTGSAATRTRCGGLHPPRVRPSCRRRAVGMLGRDVRSVRSWPTACGRT